MKNGNGHHGESAPQNIHANRLRKVTRAGTQTTRLPKLIVLVFISRV